MSLTISVVIPAYNVSKYIGAALDSLFEQSEPPDEVIIIDDGSTDETKLIVESYRRKYDFHFIHTSNFGQGRARNLGIDVVSSEYIYFFDADDLLDESFLEKLKCNIKKYDRPDIVFFSGESFNDDGYKGGRFIDYSRGFSGYYSNRESLLRDAFIHKGLLCSPCLYISKKRVWGKNGVSFGDLYLEDEAVFYPLIFSCDSFLVVDEVFFYRRNREGSTMTSAASIKHVEGALNCIKQSLKLKGTLHLSREECWFIDKRVERQCSNYINLAREYGDGICLLYLLHVAFNVKSISVVIRVLAYLLRVDKKVFFNKFGRAVRDYIGF